MTLLRTLSRAPQMNQYKTFKAIAAPKNKKNSVRNDTTDRYWMVCASIVKYKINTMMERLSPILTKIEIFVVFHFFFSSVTQKGYFDDAIRLLWCKPKNR